MLQAATPVTVRDQLRVDRRTRRLAYAQLALLVAIAGGIAYATAPRPFSLAAVLVYGVCATAVFRPVWGLYAAVFFTMVGDTVTAAWYPFTKNLSSRESILFVSDGLSLNPLEFVLIATAASWLFRSFAGPDWKLVRGRLLTPALVFAGFCFLGLVYGMSQGGNQTVALWEIRPLFYAPLVYVLVTNLLTTVRQYEYLFYTALAGVVVQSLLALDYFHRLAPDKRTDLEALTEHSSAIPMNVVLLVLVAMLTIRRGSTLRRMLILVAAIPVGWAWILSQRRAAAIAFLVGIVLVAVMLCYKNRRAAMWFIPIVTIFGIGYTLAFWNSTGSIGFAAQAIKSVIAPGSLSAKDQSSDLYRQIESFNLWYTIRAQPLFGQGFGNPFLRPVELPDISSFVFWEYMPHNSVMWIWIKTGFFGFVSMLFLIVRSIQYGMRSLLRINDPDTSIVVFGALAYVSMYMVYAYVDIAWDIRSMVFLAVAIAICADLEPLVAEDATTLPVVAGDRRLAAAAWSR